MEITDSGSVFRTLFKASAFRYLQLHKYAPIWKRKVKLKQIHMLPLIHIPNIATESI
jgi:hypothetical protein